MNFFEKSKSFASLSITHPTLKAEEITDRLELEPSFVLNDGETLYESSKYKIKQQGNNWQYELASVGTMKDLVLNDLLDDLHGKLPAIRRLQNSGAKMHITMQMDGFESVGTLHLSPEVLTRLAQLRIEILLVSRFRIDDNDGEFDEDDAGEEDDLVSDS